MALSGCPFGVLVVIAVVLAGDVAVAQRQYTGALNKYDSLARLPQPPTKVSHPPEGHFDRCQVEQGERILCGNSGITNQQCAEINCCHDGRQCYYGKAVTVQCTKDGQFVVVVARESTLPPVDVNSVSLLETNDPSCSAVDVSSTFAIFQFAMTLCGTTVKEEDGYVVYENHMSSSYDVGIGPRGSITRDSHFELLFQCRYLGTAVEALIMEVNTIPPPGSVAAAGALRVELRLGNGVCLSKGCVAEEAAYSSFYTATDYPVTKVLRDPVYVEVHILEKADPNIILNLEHCWATTTPNPQSLPQWDILVNGCPYHDDRYQTTLVPVHGSSGLHYPSHYKRFIFKMFSFVDQDTFSPQKDRVFIHCSIAVCYESSTHSCEQPCRRQRRSLAVVKSQSPGALVSSHEVILTPPRSWKR
ncbi:zona pellucida sperm-binding protein 4-like isoform X2 [Nerophis lumbriciformis]|uniref:zona pellucida sperm-binding protein 4-like isoform X2 n=1 Tax=Nerophis lumbriciformis TaxID=546530 RepID=UPI002ADF1F59|nr:zona pellucida sperm-binding protein 4-like isoform X2 [Nerophis lumbriciformis]